ncbi:MAG: 50S ribosomal protein L23 [Candidatus Thermoplasmatota archaeon]|nr:50S ribosomal protein L23 [Candidatus Thermoplasmatota archaeon]MDI6856018.1 50S ribosomal protein L23 [Candidatus Thermoplasmatota archaeon]MDI6887721.1 50S ribosomal protein L23 [Candidatus Thermoplasmatota archaeon]
MAKQKDCYRIVFYPYITEKSMGLIEKENKLEFVVKKEATKPEIKRAIEEILGVKIDKVTTRITKEGKHAIVKLKKEYSASELGMRMGVI